VRHITSTPRRPPVKQARAPPTVSPGNPGDRHRDDDHESDRHHHYIAASARPSPATAADFVRAAGMVEKAGLFAGRILSLRKSSCIHAPGASVPSDNVRTLLALFDVEQQMQAPFFSNRLNARALTGRSVPTQASSARGWRTNEPLLSPVERLAACARPGRGAHCCLP